MNVLETIAGPLSYFDNGCIEGNVPRLMLLHSGAASHRQWKTLIAELGRHWHVVAPDLIGHGETPMPASGNPMLQEEVTRLAALLERMDGPVHLAGHSYGGAMALELACRHPHRIASLAMYEPVAFGLLRDSSHRDGWREIAALGQRQIELAERGEMQAAAIAFLDYWVRPGALLTMPDHMQAYIISCMPAVAAEFRGLLGVGTAAADFTMLTMPVLLLCGSDATLAVRGVVAELRRLLPDPRYVALAGAAHMAPLTRPDLVNPLLVDFLDVNVQMARRGLRQAG
jgi:pimeloyl-ACP methyl ester carboxylesterase